jgi:hypothetical protein
MTKKIDVEYTAENGDDELIEVEFEAYPEWENDSYDDEYGTVALDDYAAINDDAKWDESRYSEKQNEIISNWYTKNWKKVYDMFCQQFVEDSKQY